MIEILAPCGGKDSFLSAVNNQADAVYLGLDNFSARKNADNFTADNIAFYVAYAHTFNVRVYVCINTLIKDSEICELLWAVKAGYEAGVDAFIVQDVFLGKTLRENFPEITLHLSTQAGVNNVYGAELAKKYGFSRVILARETDIKEIAEICKVIETEVFVHGAMCTSLSGHCYMSSFIGGNSGNRGFCRQPCRKKYSYSFFDKENYALSLSDLCLASRISELVKVGVSSFKIEGRMRSAEYVGATIRLLKKAVLGKDFSKELSFARRTFNRGNYSLGYTFGEDKNLLSSDVQGNLGEFVGKVAKFKGDKIYLSKSFSAGSGFKILRGGVEVGSAVCLSDGNTLSSSRSVKINDEVYITKDTSLEFLKGSKRLKSISVSAKLKAGEKALLSSEGITVESEQVLDSAKTAPISQSDVLAAINKTDVYPFSANLESFVGGDAFMTKSELNKLRASLYEKIYYKDKRQCAGDISKPNIQLKPSGEKKIAVITSHKLDKEYPFITDLIFAPSEYSPQKIDKFLNSDYNGSSVKYLYVPAFMSNIEILKIKDISRDFKGFYVEGLPSAELASELNKSIFLGVESNIFNSIDVAEIANIGAEKYAVSKELSLNECKSLNGYVLTLGSIKLMSLIYCPRIRKCSTCNVSNLETLTDSSGRIFPVRRYKIDKCRFEIFNESILVSPTETDKMIFDLSGLSKEDAITLLDDYVEIGLKGISKKYRKTSGNLVKGIN